MTNGTAAQRKICLSARFAVSKTSLRNVTAAFGLPAERLEEVV
jgi:hypothetical protein